MRVYLACTIRGDRSRLDVARALAGTIEAAGHKLMTRRFLEDGAADEDGRLAPAEVFERDLVWLEACELLVAEASGSSYGVGFEVGYVASRAARTGQHVIVLYDAERSEHVSRIISGNTHAHCTTIAYRDAGDASRRLRQAIAERYTAPHAGRP